MHTSLKISAVAVQKERPHATTPPHRSRLPAFTPHLEGLPWDVATLIFEKLDTHSLVAATVSNARAHLLPEPLERIAPHLCRRRYERFTGQPTYPHRRPSDATRKNTWSVLLSEQERLQRTEPSLKLQKPQAINGAKLFMKLAQLLPLWETSTPAALGSFWSRFRKTGVDLQVLASSGEQALLYLGLIDAERLRPAAHAYYCALGLAQMRRSTEALEAFEQALGDARRDDTLTERPQTNGSRFSGHLSRPAIIFSMWFIGLWLDLPCLAQRADKDHDLRLYDRTIGEELLGRLGKDEPFGTTRTERC